MKELATTLVHRAAMEIAVPAITSFAHHFKNTHSLEIHTDGSPEPSDEAALLKAAKGMDAVIVRPVDRQAAVAAALNKYPLSLKLLQRSGYFCKLELPISISQPFFYFDSDIVWLRPVNTFAPEDATSAFSTESWTWYHGASNETAWIKEKIPRRVNSGFYYVNEPFPFERLEFLLREKLFDPDRPHNTDQEIMAFLYPKMNYYHPEDLKRSRRGVIYDFKTETAAALHFPGQMWKSHLDQIANLDCSSVRESLTMRFQPAIPITHFEFFRMKSILFIISSKFLKIPTRAYRFIRSLINN